MNSPFLTSPQLLSDLRTAVADLDDFNPWHGLFRFAALGTCTLSLATFTWQSSQMIGFVLGAIATGIPYAFWLITNHDATHRTLTGWPWFDILFPRLISWPMLWPVGTYNQLHRLHHGWNATDLRDPERAQWTTVEYQNAPPWQRWYIRHQWSIDILLLGGLGLVAKTVLHGFKLHSLFPQLRKQILIDWVGIISLQSTLILGILLFHPTTLWTTTLWKYLLFWLLVERSIGVIIQVREHIEHYGLWQQAPSHQLTQLYAGRNIKTLLWANSLLGGLPYHAVHHAFPHIAAPQLPDAFQRIQHVLHQHQLPPMPQAPGYLSTTFALSRQPSLIKEQPIKNNPLPSEPITQ